MQDKPEKKTPRTLRLNARDNIIVAVDSVSRASPSQGVAATARIMRGHKMAAEPIAKGQPVLKFGQIIGFATEDIAPGSHVHTHNCSFAEFERDYAFAQDAREEILLPPEARATFEGFRRGNGKAGTRNYIGILTSVNCSASVARFMAEAVNRSGILAALPQRRRRRLVRARHGLRAGRLGRGLRGAGAHAMGLRRPSQSRRRAGGGPGLRGVPDRAPQEQVRPDRGRQLPHHDHPGHRRHQEDHRGRRGAHQGDAAARQCGAPRDDLGQRAVPRPAVRRLGRLLRHHRQPGARRRRRHARAPRRHGGAVGDAGDLRRRAPAHPARAQPRGRREAGRHHPLVAGLLRQERRLDGQQPQPRQQAGGLTTILEKSLGRRGQGRHHHAQRRSTATPSR